MINDVLTGAIGNERVSAGVAGCTNIHGSTKDFNRCLIADGRHDVTSTGGVVGVMVFGYYAVGSYQYPAGSEMRRIFFG